MKAPARLVTVAEMQFRDLRRRPVALAILAVLPLAFYLSLLSSPHYAVIAGTIGMSFAVAGASLFSLLGTRRAEPLLALSGYTTTDLLAGRLLLLLALGLVLAGGSIGLMAGLTRPGDLPALLLAGALMAAVSVPLGLCVASVLPRELEGTLTIIGIVGVELSLPANAALAPFLPLFGAVRLAEVAVGYATSPLWVALLHSAGYAALLMAISIWAWRRRLRIEPPQPLDPQTSAWEQQGSAGGEGPGNRFPSPT